MSKGFIELDLDKINEIQSGHIVPNLVQKSSSTATEYISSSMFQQMKDYSKHNISRLVRKVESEMNGAKNSISNISDFVQECHENYLNLDNFLATSSSASTTSSTANSVIGSMTSIQNFGLEIEVPNSKVKLDYHFKFHPIVRAEKKVILSSKNSNLKPVIDEVETL